MLDYTGYTIVDKTERSKTGISRLLIAKFEFQRKNYITDDKVKSGHFPPNVFGFDINI